MQTLGYACGYRDELVKAVVAIFLSHKFLMNT